MKTDIRLSEGKFTFIKKGQSNYILESYSQKYDSVHYNDGRDYLTGEADINLRDENGNNKKIVDVKIYLDKNDQYPIYEFDDCYPNISKYIKNPSMIDRAFDETMRISNLCLDSIGGDICQYYWETILRILNKYGHLRYN